MRHRPLSFKRHITLRRLALAMIMIAILPVGAERLVLWRQADVPASVTRLSGAVTHIRDGDTIEVQGTAVRIANLDCAELGTPEGEAAKTWIGELLAGASVDCDLSGRKSYDRQLGTCRFGGADLGEILIGEGICGRWID